MRWSQNGRQASYRAGQNGSYDLAFAGGGLRRPVAGQTELEAAGAGTHVVLLEEYTKSTPHLPIGTGQNTIRQLPLDHCMVF